MTSQFLCILRIYVPLPPGSTAACSASATSVAHQLPQACVVPPSGINNLVASEILNALPWPLPWWPAICLVFLALSTLNYNGPSLHRMRWSILLDTKESEWYNLEMWRTSLPNQLQRGDGRSLAHKFSLHPPSHELFGGTIYPHSLCTDIHRHPKWTHLPSDLLCFFVAHCETLSHITLQDFPFSLPYFLCPYSHCPVFVRPQRSIST